MKHVFVVGAWGNSVEDSEGIREEYRDLNTSLGREWRYCGPFWSGYFNADTAEPPPLRARYYLHYSKRLNRKWCL